MPQSNLPRCAQAADMWSLGVTLYAMSTGRVPWSGASASELQQRVLHDPLLFPPTMSVPLRALLTRLLDTNPATRATMQEVKVGWMSGIYNQWFGLCVDRLFNQCLVI